ncbi:MAG: T9SS type A sorting domain-containing protein [Ignavibacteriaceae bacterium]|nr:T9SS type A sorting domain-containing protein [Ignavibacterium sp.]MCC6256161.1 T9SS type A sorting domain-containing protein [Ignavibacteriaceae bacterium]HRN27460.1 C25 family cysteine peptidase [Ignavibacteriaceae bacterium]HRP91244.1 C25 family cysteine peptidase [Ignavibacteriaceae bacterium]HRQ52746.1 C25 family cysteine peptidase [Ignavibacteriaceae bacterium]
MKIISALLVIVLFQTNFPQGITLRDTTNQYDYIIITVPEFVPACQTFKQHKESYNGFNVLIVDTGQIYTEFNSDSLPQNNIREFISYAGTYWQQPYVICIMLVGTVNQVPNFQLLIPPHIVPNPYHKTDYFYGINKNSIDTTLISYAVGRVPAKNINEVENYFSKVVDYEGTTGDSTWINNSLFVYEHEEQQMFGFQEFSHVLANLQPSNINSKFYTNSDTSSEYGNKDSIISFLNNPGVSLLIFEGHNSDSSLVNNDYFNVSDVSELNNNGKYFITLFTGGQYAILDSNSNLCVKMLLQNNSGSIASICPSSIVYWNLLRSIHQYWIYKIFDASNITISKLVDLSNLPSNDLMYSMKTSINYLGDPSLKLKYDPVVNVTENNQEIPDGYVLNSNYPNPYNNSTKISYEIPVQSNVSIILYDVLGREVATLVNEVKQSGKHQFNFVEKNLVSGVYFYTLRAGNFVQTKKMILLK